VGRARALAESLATLESIVGIDFRELSKNIAGNIAKKTGGDTRSQSRGGFHPATELGTLVRFLRRTPSGKEKVAVSRKKHIPVGVLGAVVWIAFLVPVARASVFYEFDVVAMTGQAGLTGIEGAPSINDFGRVAFVGDFGDSEGVFVHDPGDWPAQPRNIAPGWGSFDITPGVQINNANRVIGHYRGPGFHNRVGIWDSNAEDSFETVATGYFDLPAADFDVTFPWPSINNNGAAAFSAGLWEGNQLNIYLLRPGSCDYPVPNFCGVTPGGTVLSGIQPLIADDAGTVLRFGSFEDSTAPIRVYSTDLSTYTTVASLSDFTTLGRRPGISDDGKVIAFAADRGNGPGIFLWFDDDPPFIWVIQGDGVPDPPYFSSFEMDTRVAVTRIDLGAEGFEDDRIVVCFMATPNAPPRTNSDELGIWTVRVDIEREPKGGNLIPHLTGPIPVVQIGDTLQTPSGPRVVTSLAVHDPLANPAGDHRVAFWAAAGAEHLVVRAVQVGTGRVVFVDAGETPICNATVEAYVHDGQEILQVIDETTTGEDGRFTRLAVFSDPQYAADRLGLRAKIRYTDPGTGQEYPIVNYPNNEPFPQKGHITGTETICFPYPVVLQAGWRGSTQSWGAFATYLRADTGSSGQKTTHGLPAFMTFAMPKDSEPPSWGYDNGLPEDKDNYEDNIYYLNEFIKIAVCSALEELVPDQHARVGLPINLCGHSMGGPITRGWMHANRGQNPRVKRYVSFDGVHGGTAFVGFGWWKAKGFAEWYMNGFNDEPNAPPKDIHKPWNYTRFAPTSGDFLLMSSPNWPDLVTPDSSAFGVGRTMKQSDYSQPNGHTGRFIGGVECSVDAGHIGFMNDPAVTFLATWFLAQAHRPPGGKLSGDDRDGEDVGSPCAPGLPPGCYWGKLAGSVHEVVEVPLYIDTNPSIDVSAAVEGADAAFDMLDPNGQSLVPDDAEIIDFEGGAFIIMFSIDAPPVGVSTLQLAAGDEAATAYVTIAFDNQRWLRLDLPEEPVVPDAPVTVAASVREADDTVITGSGGSIEVTITLPDETEQTLPLFDDGSHGDGDAGDGIYANTFDATALGGRYLVEGHAQITVDSETIERTAIGMFVVDSSPAYLVGVTDERAVDEDADGKIDRLEIDLEVSIDEAGDYQLMGVLQDYMQDTISNDYVLFEVQDVPSSYTATLQFDAATLVAHGVDGPWTLTQIELFDDDQALLVDTLEDYLTAPHDLNDFASPPAPDLVRALPDYGPNEGGNEIVLQGDHFEHVMAITIGGQAPPEFEVLSDTAIRVVVPPAGTPKAGPVKVELTSAWHSVPFPDAFTYLPRIHAEEPGGDVQPHEVRPIPPP